MRDRLVKKVTEMRRVISFTIFTFILIVTARSQAPSFKVLFYNTENLFDTVDDTLKNDEEFLSDGSRHWTKNRYYKKIDCIARVIVAAGEWEPPAVVGLCEVENERVVKDLVNSEILAGLNYSYVHFDSPDKRGIDICLLYRPGMVKVLTSESWLPPARQMPEFDSRNVLLVKAEIFSDTISFIVCHWPSMRGGLLAGNSQRNMVSETIIHRTDSLRKTMSAGEKIIMMGDFNCSPDLEILKTTAKECGLINLSTTSAANGKGSYRFRGKWEMIDQIFVSENMINDKSGRSIIYNTFFAPVEKNFLLEDDPGYPGKRPFSTYRDYKWEGGYSDHLPVLLILTQKH
jgi:hypothetical protein